MIPWDASRSPSSPPLTAYSAAVRARWAVTTVFFFNGMTISSFMIRVPTLRFDLGLSEGSLGVVLALFGVFAILSMQLVGSIAARRGSSWVVRPATIGISLALLAIGLSGGMVQLAVAVMLFGVVHGMLDVTMNAHAVSVERALGRPIMSGCHAGWSIGGVAGSALGGVTIQLGWTIATHYLVLCSVLLVAALVTGSALLSPSVDRSSRAMGAAAPPVSWRVGWTPRVLLFGAMGATVLVCVGAVGNWSGVYLIDHLGASLTTASLGFILYSSFETALRLFGDRLNSRFGAPTLVRAGAIAAAAGLVTAVLATRPWVALVGFAVMGLGLATPLPVLFSTVGHAGSNGPGASVFLSRFTTMTYSGILLGPFVIGWSAEVFGLVWTLAGLVPLLLWVSWNAGVTGSPRASAVP